MLTSSPRAGGGARDDPATYAEQVQRYAWALVEVMAPALAQDWQLAVPSVRVRTAVENCTRLNLPVPEWIIEATESGEMA